MAIKSKRIGEQVSRNTLGRIRVLNDSGVAISKGDILSVTAVSASGGHLTVVKGDADAATSVRCDGMKLVADHDIATGSTGIAVDWAIVDGNTNGMTVGEELYLGNGGDAGGWVQVGGKMPAAGGHYTAIVGQVLDVAVAGKVLLAPQKWREIPT